MMLRCDTTKVWPKQTSSPCPPVCSGSWSVGTLGGREEMWMFSGERSLTGSKQVIILRYKRWSQCTQNTILYSQRTMREKSAKIIIIVSRRSSLQSYNNVSDPALTFHQYTANVSPLHGKYLQKYILGRHML